MVHLGNFINVWRVRKVPYAYDAAVRRRCFRDGVGARWGAECTSPFPPSFILCFATFLLLPPFPLSLISLSLFLFLFRMRAVTMTLAAVALFFSVTPASQKTETL